MSIDQGIKIEFPAEKDPYEEARDKAIEYLSARGFSFNTGKLCPICGGAFYHNISGEFCCVNRDCTNGHVVHNPTEWVQLCKEEGFKEKVNIITPEEMKEMCDNLIKKETQSFLENPDAHSDLMATALRMPEDAPVEPEDEDEDEQYGETEEEAEWSDAGEVHTIREEPNPPTPPEAPLFERWAGGIPHEEASPERPQDQPQRPQDQPQRPEPQPHRQTYQQYYRSIFSEPNPGLTTDEMARQQRVANLTDQLREATAQAERNQRITPHSIEGIFNATIAERQIRRDQQYNTASMEPENEQPITTQEDTGPSPDQR